MRATERVMLMCVVNMRIGVARLDIFHQLFVSRTHTPSNHPADRIGLTVEELYSGDGLAKARHQKRNTAELGLSNAWGDCPTLINFPNFPVSNTLPTETQFDKTNSRKIHCSR